MNIRQQLKKENSKKNFLKIVAYIGADKKRFAELMDIFFNYEYRVVQRAAWLVSHCSQKHPELIKPWLRKLILNLNKPGIIDAVKRNTVRLLQFIGISKSLQGYTAGICFDYLSSPTEPIAVKVFSMTVLFNIGKSEPGINNELKLLIEENMPYASAGFKSRANKILRGIK